MNPPIDFADIAARTKAAPATAALEEQDAELIGLCARVVAIEAEQQTICDAQHAIAEEYRNKPVLDRLYAERRAILERCFEIQDPKTLAGAMAMAGAALALAPRDNDGKLEYQGDAEWFAFGVSEFLTGKTGRAVA